jgi:hypothetical protein
MTNPADQAEGTGLLLQELMALAPALKARAEQVMTPLAGTRDELRQRLLDEGWILPVPNLPMERPDTMCAVDGARLTNKMSGADMMVAVATCADGMFVARQAPTVSAVWADIAPHASDLDKVAGTAMACLELHVAAHVTHQIRLLDGSFFTPVIEFSKGIAVGTAEVRNHVTDLMTERDAVANLASILAFNPDRPVLALPKSETVTQYRDLFADMTGQPITVTDRVLAAQLLDSGEILRPRPIHEWARTRIQAHSDAARRTRDLAAGLSEALAPFQEAIADRTALTCYFKPARASQALRFEYQSSTPDGVDLALHYARLLSHETNTPHMMEPTAQWAVDKKAKDISNGARALRAALINQLDDTQARTWGRLIAEDYRT